MQDCITGHKTSYTSEVICVKVTVAVEILSLVIPHCFFQLQNRLHHVVIPSDNIIAVVVGHSPNPTLQELQELQLLEPPRYRHCQDWHDPVKTWRRLEKYKGLYKLSPRNEQADSPLEVG